MRALNQFVDSFSGRRLVLIGLGICVTSLLGIYPPLAIFWTIAHPAKLVKVYQNLEFTGATRRIRQRIAPLTFVSQTCPSTLRRLRVFRHGDAVCPGCVVILKGTLANPSSQVFIP